MCTVLYFVYSFIFFWKEPAHCVIQYDKVIYSIKHNTYIVINTQLATCFTSSEPTSGQYLVRGHGSFSECAHYGIPSDKQGKKNTL